MRRCLAPLVLSLALGLPSLFPLAAAQAAPGAVSTEEIAEEVYAEATIGWPAGPATVGESAYVTVTGTNISETTHVYLRRSNGGSADGPLVDTGELTPDTPTVSLRVPTGQPGTRKFYIRVETSGDWDGLVDEDWGKLTVRGKPTTLTAELPNGRVRAGASSYITGTVSGASERRVQLQAKGRNGTWVPLAETRSGKDGTFSLRTPTWWVARQRLRAYAPGTDTYAAAATDTTGTITVRRRYKPRRGRQFSYMFGHQARWDPCQVITYRVNPRRMPAGGLGQVRSAFRAVSEATGLRFKYAGRTRFVPLLHGRSRENPRDTDIALAWASPRLVPPLAGNTLGYGGSYISNGELFDGYVVLDSTQRIGRTARQNRLGWRAAMLHEIGHSIGLTHVRDPRQIMAPTVTSRSPTEYAAGDLRGLRAVGAINGCVKNSIR